MKRAYLVLGPESSGTRMMTRLLMVAGCNGDGGSVQRWDTKRPAGQLVVWRRSVPHKREWPDIDGMIRQLERGGYAVTALVMARDWHAVARSQVANHPPVAVDEATTNIRRAYRHIFARLSNTPYELVCYEALVARPYQAIVALFERLALPVPIGAEIYDGNAKYYEQVPA